MIGSSLRATLVVLALASLSGTALAKPCHPTAIRALERFSPEGFRVFRHYPDKADFKRWIECDDLQGGLATAVHETIHAVTANRDAYPLVRGGTAWRVPESPDFYPPRLLRSMFSAESQYVISYLTPGAASSADFFRYLLDELNAYSHDLNTIVHLDSIRERDFESGHRDGLAALMAFVATYVDMAHRRHPRTWSALQTPKVRRTVVTLWEQAVDVMGRSCHLARYSFETPGYLAKVCGATDRHGLGRLLGHPPRCPIRCKIQVASASVGGASVIPGQPGYSGLPQPAAAAPRETTPRFAAPPIHPRNIRQPPAQPADRAAPAPTPQRESWVQRFMRGVNPDGG